MMSFRQTEWSVREVRKGAPWPNIRECLVQPPAVHQQKQPQRGLQEARPNDNPNVKKETTYLYSMKMLNHKFKKGN